MKLDDLITEEKIRPYGRQLDEMRPLNAQVDLLTTGAWVSIIYSW